MPADAKKFHYRGSIPSLDYEDAGAMLDWLTRVFGFRERSRYVDKDGIVRQAEMRMGDFDLWFAGHDRGYWDTKGHGPEGWILVLVDDVDAHHAHVTAQGVDAKEPADQSYGMRTYQVTDPEGHHWNFMQALGTPYVQTKPTEEGGLAEILAENGIS